MPTIVGLRCQQHHVPDRPTSTPSSSHQVRVLGRALDQPGWEGLSPRGPIGAAQEAMKRYLVNEIFHSLQGEGCNAGIPMTFVRFAKCNLACSKAIEGFDCDTDFARGDWYDTGELASAILAHRWTGWLLFTGGEPALQLDGDLVELTHAMGYKIAIETNGTPPLAKGHRLGVRVAQIRSSCRDHRSG